MQIKLPFLVDPKTKEQSVSLSLLVVSFTALLVASTVHLAKLTENTSSLTELFMTCAGLYFSRRVSFKSGNTIEAKAESENK
jgi:hypothetical protein